MSDKELHKLLKRVHNEIEHTETVDEAEQELLSDLSSDIRELLERSEGSRLNPHPTIISRLNKTIDRLEISHPTLTASLSKLLSILSNAGI